MTPEKLQEILDEAKNHPLHIGDLFQVDYYTHGYEHDRMIHTVIGLYEKFVQFEDTHAVVLKNPFRIVQECSRTEKINFRHTPFDKLSGSKYRIFETQVITSPQQGLELVDLTSAGWIYYGSAVIETGVIYYNCRVLGESYKDARENLRKVRTSLGFTD